MNPATTDSPPGTSFRPWLLRAPRADAQARVFCLPYSGVGASMYRNWPAVVHGARGLVDLVPVQFPRRENRIREPHYGTYEELGAGLSDALLPFLDRPFAIFGHCAGAHIAFETAHQLDTVHARPPERLIVSSQPAPWSGGRSAFAEMTEEQLRGELLELIDGMGGAPTPELLEIAMSVYRPDLKAARCYAATHAFSTGTEVTVVGWAESGVDLSALAGWADHGPCRLEVLPGDHYAFLAFPAELAVLLSTWPDT